MPRKPFLTLDAQKRQTLLDQAADIFIERSYEEITIKLLLDTMGMNPATFYRYFEDLDDLYVTIIEQIDIAAMERIKSRSPELSEELFFPNSDVIPFMGSAMTPKEVAMTQTVYKVPDSVLMKTFFGPYKDYTFNHAKTALRKMRYNGRLQPQVDDDLIAYLYSTMMFTLIMFFREYGIVDPDIQTKMRSYMFMDFFLNGIINKDKKEGGE